MHSEQKNENFIEFRIVNWQMVGKFKNLSKSTFPPPPKKWKKIDKNASGIWEIFGLFPYILANHLSQNEKKSRNASGIWEIFGLFPYILANHLSQNEKKSRNASGIWEIFGLFPYILANHLSVFLLMSRPGLHKGNKMEHLVFIYDKCVHDESN